MNATVGIAIAIPTAIAIHESAHALTARALGVRVTRLGIDWRGVYLVREPGRPWQNALISFAGPLANLVTAYATLRLRTGWELCLMSAELGAYNLLPLPGSDGLRILKLVATSRSAMNAFRNACLLFASIFRCQHFGAGERMPVNGRQHCPDCGAFRFYELGGTPSKWHRYKYEGHPTGMEDQRQ